MSRRGPEGQLRLVHDADGVQVLARAPRQGAPVPSRLDPVPVPREIGRALPALAALGRPRGLGSMLTGERPVVRMDPVGPAVKRQIDRRVRENLVRALQGAGSGVGTRWESWSDLVVEGLPIAEVRKVWGEVAEAAIGAGISCREPGFFPMNSYDHDRRAVRHRIVLDFDSVPVEATDRPRGPYLADGGPDGHRAVLEEQDRAFRLDGWLWVPACGNRVGVRLRDRRDFIDRAGLAVLDGAAHEWRTDPVAALDLMIRDPSKCLDLPPDLSFEAQVLIDGFFAKVSKLSLRGAGPDLVLAIFEAFHRQRNTWARGELDLPGVGVVEGFDEGVIAVDPSELRLRLGAGAASGKNWRSVLFEKISTLAALDLRTWRLGEQPEPLDLGIDAVVDGRTENAVGGDLARDVAQKLRSRAAMPSDLFFIVMSKSRMKTFFTWNVEDNGYVAWGSEVAKLSRTRSREHGVTARKAGNANKDRNANSATKALKDEIRKKPYWTHHPRVSVLAAKEGWPQQCRLLIVAVLQEVRQSKKYDVIEGFIGANGSRGHGYRVATWMKKAGYASASLTAFLDDLSALVDELSFTLALQTGEDDAEAVLARLRCDRGACRDAVLKVYVPVDLDDRIRERLMGSGIEHEPGLDRPGLRARRHAVGLTQGQLADRLGVSKSVVSRWESGSKPIPSGRIVELEHVLEGGSELTSKSLSRCRS